MKTIKFNGKIYPEEREVVLIYDGLTKHWLADTNISKFLRKFKKMDWKQTKEYVNQEGEVIGGSFEAPTRAITVRSTKKKQVSANQITNLFSDDDE